MSGIVLESAEIADEALHLSVRVDAPKQLPESTRPRRRPQRSFSVFEKLDAIQRVNNGESKASVGRSIGVPESTLRGWCKSEQKIRGMAINSSAPDSHRNSHPRSSTGAAVVLTQADEEAIQHGQKFMEWLRSYNEPGISPLQITELETVLSAIKNGKSES